MAGENESLSDVEANQYPQAHIGHLTAQQSQSLSDFRDYCQKQGYYTPASGGAGRASHDDETLLYENLLLYPLHSGGGRS